MTKKTKTLKQLSEMLGKTHESIRIWFVNHPEIDNDPKLVIKDIHGKKTNRLITEQGAKTYLMLKATASGNRYRQSNNSIVCKEKKLKSDIINTVIDENKIMVDKKEYEALQTIATNVNTRLLKLENTINSKEEKPLLMLGLSEPTVAVPELTKRDEINMMVRSYATNKKCNYQVVWNYVYQQFYYRYKKNVKAIQMEEDKTLLDTVDRIGMIDELYALVILLFKGK